MSRDSRDPTKPRDQVLAVTARGFAASLLGVARLPDPEIERIAVAAPELEAAVIELIQRLRAAREEAGLPPLVVEFLELPTQHIEPSFH